MCEKLWIKRFDPHL